MKYTKYVIDGEFFDMSILETDRKLLKIPAVLVSIPVATLGLALLTSILPATVAIDETRRLKYNIIKYKRRNNYKIK